MPIRYTTLHNINIQKRTIFTDGNEVEWSIYKLFK